MSREVQFEYVALTYPHAIPTGKLVYSKDDRLLRPVTQALFDYEVEHGRGDMLKGRDVTGAVAREGIVVLDWKGRLAGGLTFDVAMDWVWLRCGYVWPQHRRKGLYREIVNALVIIAKSNNLSGLWVSTFDWEAPAVYEALGFRRGTIYRDCPKGNTSIDFIMELSGVGRMNLDAELTAEITKRMEALAEKAGDFFTPSKENAVDILNEEMAKLVRSWVEAEAVRFSEEGEAILLRGLPLEVLSLLPLGVPGISDRGNYRVFLGGVEVGSVSYRGRPEQGLGDSVITGVETSFRPAVGMPRVSFDVMYE